MFQWIVQFINSGKLTLLLLKHKGRGEGEGERGQDKEGNGGGGNCSFYGNDFKSYKFIETKEKNSF